MSYKTSLGQKRIVVVAAAVVGNMFRIRWEQQSVNYRRHIKKYYTLLLIHWAPNLTGPQLGNSII